MENEVPYPLKGSPEAAALKREMAAPLPKTITEKTGEGEAQPNPWLLYTHRTTLPGGAQKTYYDVMCDDRLVGKLSLMSYHGLGGMMLSLQTKKTFPTLRFSWGTE